MGIGRAIGALMIIAGWLGGIALWLTLLIALSVLPFVEAVNADPVDSHAIAWAVIWFFLSKIAGAVAAFVLVGVGMLTAAASD